MEKLKYAIIGCGRISKKHIEALINNSPFYLPVACVDIKKDLAEDNAAKIEEYFPGIKVNAYTSYHDMLLREKPDVAAIATESGYHPAITLDAVKEGVHVICEKPMALSIKDCDRVISEVNKSGVKATLSIQNRFNPPIKRLKNAIDQNKFGRIFHGQISVRWNRNVDYYNKAGWRNTWDLDGGALMNQCSHGIDLLQWMLGGKVKSVFGVTRKYNSPREAEDFGSAIVEFDEGVVGLIEGSVNIFPRNLEEKLSVFGEKGTVTIGGLAVNHVETWRFQGEEFEEKRDDPATVYGNGHTFLYQDFADAILNNRTPYIPIEEGKKSVEIILAIQKSMKTGEKVKLPFDFSTTDMKGTFPVIDDN